MQWLVTLVTPPGGTVLYPFAGSGSTGKAAMRLGLSFIGMEQDEEFCAIAEARIKHEFAKQAQTVSTPVKDAAEMLQPTLLMAIPS
jgi:site-specific DNA-methyltransferase (adenine-specific)